MSERMIRKNIWFSESDIDWVEQNYKHAKLAYIMRNLLSNFIRSHTGNESALEDHLKTASDMTKDDIL